MADQLIRFDHIVKRFHVGTPDETTLFDGFDFGVDEGNSSPSSDPTGQARPPCSTCCAAPCRWMPAGSITGTGTSPACPNTSGRPLSGGCSRIRQRAPVPDLTILENMALADNKKGRYSLAPAIGKKRIDAYRSMLEICNMGLENRLGQPVGSLSGGQRQALALVIAGMTDIDILVLDEHTAALDPKSSERVMEITRKLVEERKVTTLMVTHNLRFAVQYGTRLVMMHAGQAVLDLKEEEKRAASVDVLLQKFNEISIECGN